MIGNEKNETKAAGSPGMVIVEFCIALPLLIAVLFGTIEYGRAFLLRESLVTAAWEAARVGSQSSCPRPTDAEAIDAAGAMLEQLGLDSSSASISVENAGGTSGTDLVVEVSYEAEFPVLSKVMSVVGESLDVTVRVEAENE